MQVFEYQGEYAPSTLFAQIRDANIDCVGVTCHEDDEGNVTAVQVICPDATDEAAVAAAVAAYTPPQPPPDVATADEHAAISAEIVAEKLAAIPVTREQLPAILERLLGEASSAIPYYEGFTLQPDPATAWANFQTLDQPTKDRILYNCCRSLAALMRYLSGDLQPGS